MRLKNFSKPQSNQHLPCRPGAVLAFALSFDEVVVTIFTAPPGVGTLPIWILKEMAMPNQVSVVNVVATVVIVVSLIPVYVSQRLSRTENENENKNKK